MKKDRLFFPVLFVILVILCIQNDVLGQDGVKWSGTVSFYEKTTGTEGLIREWRMDAMITNDTGRAYHTSTWSSDKGSGSCNNQGKSELDVGIDDEKRTYRILAHVPGCIGTQTINGVESVYPVTDETGIAINDQPLGTNRNVLSGRTVTTDRPDDVTTITTIYEWNLRRGPLDVELIVTPQNYDNWMPEPGADGNESTLGNKITVLLRLQKRGGGKPDVKARFFEVRLSGTSDEKGVTINYPLDPPDPEPDLRFLEQEEAVLSAKDQFIRIPVDDGINGYVEIGSFDGGGWSTLTVVAILESGDSIKGNLIRTGGITQIPVPKRNAGSHIAIAWLMAYGNQGEADDNEMSKGNKRIGDGLTVYEEYRGVFSEKKFRRLDPVRKELGVWSTKEELEIFSEGIKWFEDASDIEVVPFYKFEIFPDRKLNRNGFTAFRGFQYVLKLVNGSAGGKAYGVTEAKARPWIPANIEHVTVDVSKIDSSFRSRSAAVVKQRVARTTAHEIAHGVNVEHHGDSTKVPDVTAHRDSLPRYLIFNEAGSRISRRSYTMEHICRPNNEQSGDVTCFIVYLRTSLWSSTGRYLDSLVHYEVPDVPVDKKLCTSEIGTGINDPLNVGINGVNKYFGNAPRGNCLSRIRLK